MKRCRPSSNLPEGGVSEILAQFLIIILVVLLIAIVIGDITGIIPKMLQKPALLSVKASGFNTTSGIHVISLLNQQGNPVNINGSSQTEGVSPLSFTLTTPSNTDVIVRNSSAIAKKAWNPGDRIYIYQVGGYYYVTDDIDWLNIQPLLPVPSGSWSVNVIDARIGLLLHKLPVDLP